MRTNILTIRPLIHSGLRVEYMIGSLDTTHGDYHVSVSEGIDGGFMTILTKDHNVVYIKTFPTMRSVMDVILTFVDNDERFSKVTD